MCWWRFIGYKKGREKMALFAIADLHFAFSVDKPMDIFGENWMNHSEKIITSRKEHITEEESVLLP